MGRDSEQGTWGKLVFIMFLGILLCLLIPGTDNGNPYDLKDYIQVSENHYMDADSLGLYDGYTPHIPSPLPFTLTQPDGQKFTARMQGDILGGHHETVEGFSIVQDESGFWTYAIQDAQGLLVPTEHIVGITDPEEIPGIEMHITNSPSVKRENSDQKEFRGTRAPPVTGTTRALAIMINFTDNDFDPGNDNAHFQQILNGTSGNTMRTYYREVSYGVFDIEVDVVGPYLSAHTMGYYGEDGTGRDNKNGPIYQMAREAVQLADADGVNFTKYDMDFDSKVDALFIIHAGSGQEDGGPSNEIWSHQGVIFPAQSTDDGISANVYSTEPEDGKIGVFCHEFGHVLDLPDLYDSDYGGSGGQSNGIGDWGLMGGGSWNGGGNSPAHMSAWSKVMVGWVEPIIVTSDVSTFSIEVPPVEDYPVIYKLWAHDPAQNTSEYFLVENRHKKGFDNALPGEGILIWHIDDTVGSIGWNTVNNNPTHLRVDLEEAHGGTQHLITRANQGDANDPWVGLAKNFTDTSDPDSNSYNGSATGVWVWNISDILPDDNITIGFNEINTGPTGIYIEDPVSSILILPVYDFVLNDTEFPDEDVVTGGGTLTIQHSWPGLGVWSDTPFQTIKSWTPGVGGVINCTGLPNGTWDFRVKVTDEEGHIWYTQVITNVMILDLAPPIADAGPDFSVGTDVPGVFDASGSSDDSGFIAWYNWTFGDGEIYNGFSPVNATITHAYTTPGLYVATLNVSDAQLNWATDIVNVTVYDATPPETNLTITGPQYRDNDTHDWNITWDTIFSLSAWDKFSGVNHTWYKIDSDYFQYSGSFDLQAYPEGGHLLTWGSEDGVGNNDTGQMMWVWIDESAPSTDYIIGEPLHEKTQIDGVNVTSSTRIYLVPTDNPAHGSGIALTWFYIDSDYYEGLNFTLAGYGEGMHTISAGSLDNLDHNATGNQIQIWVDDSAPITNMVIDDPKHPAAMIDGVNVSNETTINLVGVDQPSHGSGVNFTWYFIDDDYYVGTSFNLSAYSEGYHNITWGSEDYLFHNESANKVMIWIDETPPDTHLSVWDPHHPFVPYNGSNITSVTGITLSSVDGPVNHSAGVDFLWYTIDGDLYKGTSFNLTGYGEGSHIVTWGAQDHLGHNETGNEYILWVDDSTPKTILTIGPDKFPDDNDYGCNVTPYAEFEFTSIDHPSHNSSVRYEWYTINEKWYIGNNFSFSDFGLEEGRYNLTWGSIDWLGNNETGNAITVFVDRRAPTIDPILADPSYRDFGYEILNVTNTSQFHFNVFDPYSGIAFSWYIIDGEFFKGDTFDMLNYTEGIHTITYGAQDNLGHNKTQETLQIFLDISPPNSSLVIGEPKFRATPLDYWTVTWNTPLSIFSQDNSAGVHLIWFIIDGIYYEELYDIGYFFTLVNATEGLQNITWGSKDRLGNNMTGTLEMVWADIDPPATELSIADPNYGDLSTREINVTSHTPFYLSASDNISGWDFSWYTIDGVLHMGTSFNFSGEDMGKHFLTWGSQDLLGNNESENLISVVLDDDSPTTTISPGEPKFRSTENDHWNVTGNTAFTLTSTDMYTEVAFTWHTIDGMVFEGSEFDLSGYADGLITITWGAQDNLGNNETGNLMFVYLDNTPGVTQINLTEPKYRLWEDHLWNVTQSMVFNLNSHDEFSGVSSIWYSIDGDLTEGDSFRLTGLLDGIHEISYGSFDNLGNEEVAQTIFVNMDSTEPLTTIMIRGEFPELNEKFTLNSSTYITLISEDGMGSGIDFIWYSIDGGSKYYVYEEAFTIPNTTSTINFGARDLLGINASSKRISVIVDDREPVDEEPEPEPEPDEDDEFSDGFIKMLMDFLPFIIIILVVVIILVALMRRRKGKEEEVDFQAQPQAAPQVVEMEVIEEQQVVFQEERKASPPPKQKKASQPPKQRKTSPPPPPPPPPPP
jgi:immune inhibitor A